MQAIIGNNKSNPATRNTNLMISKPPSPNINPKKTELEAEIAKLESIIEQLGVEKAKSKKRIKEWTSNFTEANNREPSASDKVSVKELFVDHKKVSDCNSMM